MKGSLSVSHISRREDSVRIHSKNLKSVTALRKRDAFSKKALEDGYKQDFLVKTGLSIQHEDRVFDRFAGQGDVPYTFSFGTGTRFWRKSAQDRCQNGKISELTGIGDLSQEPDTLWYLPGTKDR